MASMNFFQQQKVQNVQSLIFQQLGYNKVKNGVHNLLDMTNNDHVSFYKEEMLKYWSPTQNHKHIFILLNQNENTQDLVLTRLTETNIPVDYVIVPVDDTIHNPLNPAITPHSLEAYQQFYNTIKEYVQVQ